MIRDELIINEVDVVQGDPGTSRFFLSLDDNLLRLLWTKIQNFMQTQISDDSPLESEFLSKSLDSAQERVEERAYQQRKIYSIMMMS
jgi:preprotein translocase subunit SecA